MAPGLQCRDDFIADKLYPTRSISTYKVYLIVWAQLFESRLALNPGFFFLCSKAFSRIIFSAIFRASNHQLVDKKN